MASREEALRRILHAAAPKARLTEEQRREIVTHLDEAVDAKMQAGRSEIDAVAEALVDLGDLKRIARRFPPPAAPVAVTPEGAKVRTSAELRAWAGFAVLVFSAGIAIFGVPPIEALFHKVKLALPGYSVFFLGVSGFCREFWPLTLLIFAAIGLGVHTALRTRWKHRLGLSLYFCSVLFCLGLMLALFLPLYALWRGLQP